MAEVENITFFSPDTIWGDANVSMLNPYNDPTYKGFGFSSVQGCMGRLGQYAKLQDELSCPGVFDTVLCWPSAPANTRVELPCPQLYGLKPYEKASKFCGPDGLWESKKKGEFVEGVGHTNYITCYTEEAWATYNRYLANKTAEEKRFIKTVVTAARTLEIVGLSISLVATIISLVIFCYFRSLKCHRTRIHKNLFVAIIVQISAKLIQYVDQLVAREAGGKVAGASSGHSNTMFDTPVFCEIMYSLYEYTKTVKFMWMFIEGLYLHNMIAISVFSLKPNYNFFYAFGWGVPVSLTIAWAIPTALTSESRCWAGYYNSNFIYILETPRAAVMCINLFFLLNIIRVLVVKLRESQTTEASQVRKAVKAAIVLLPLLGLTNFVIMLEPDGKNRIEFSVYTFSSAVLTAFEGFFIALLYCFLNGEVRQTVRRHWERYRQHRLIHNSNLRKLSRSLSIFTSFTEVPHPSSQATAEQQNNQSMDGEQKTRLGRRLSSIYRAGNKSRRQTNQDVQNVADTEFRSNIELPEMYNCRTDLMTEEHTDPRYNHQYV